jgi:hypothetical protein
VVEIDTQRLTQSTDRKAMHAVRNLKVCVTSNHITFVLNLLKIGQIVLIVDRDAQSSAAIS